MLKDSDLENYILFRLHELEELNDSVGPTNLRHHISEVIVHLREDIRNYNQERDELDTDLFKPEVAVADKYIDLLESRSVKLKKDENNPTSHGHLMWMLDQIVSDIFMSHTKKNRWLGYVQGCLVKDKIIDVDTERNETRNIFKGK